MLIRFCGMAMILAASQVHAESILNYLTDANGKYVGPTVEDQVALMDKDGNGFADVFEVRAYLELQHGKGYQKALLDRWQLSAAGNSCGASSAKELYIETHLQQNTN